MRRRRLPFLLGLGLAVAIGTGLRAAQQAAPARADLDEIRKVSALLETDVLNRANETIAEIEDVVLSPQGEVLYAILSYGGVAGVGAKYTAIPWDLLDAQHVNGKWAANLDMTEDALKQAPTFPKDDFRVLTNPQWVAQARQFFAGRGGRPGREPGAQANRAVSWVLRASKLIDAPLRGAGNETIGEVEDLLLDRNGRVAFAIIGRGGVLNIGEKYVPVPWSALGIKYDPNDMSVTTTINMTREQLEKAPLVEGDNYSTLLNPGFPDQVNRYFGAARPTGNQPPDQRQGGQP